MGEGTTIDLAALRSRLATEEGSRLWRSLEELADVPEVRRHIEAEFPDIMETSQIDRRTLLRLMSASLALGGLAACNGSDVGTKAPLLSQSHNMPGYVPGVPVTIATSLPLNGYGRGVLVKAQEGRPIKIEGNRLHPASLGATDVFAQAEILSLYDPDRSDAPLQDGVPRSWEDLTNFIRPVRNELVVDEGRGLHILMPPTTSPTLHRLVGQARQLFPHAQWHVFTPIDDGNRQAAAMAVFGRDVELVYDLTQADSIVTLGGDLFAEEPGHIRYAADYQARRRVLGRGLPQLFAVETRPSLLGARADERVPLRPRDFDAFAEALAAALDHGTAPSGSHPAIPRLADALRRAGTRSLVVAGREQPARVHALALAINARLGAFGTTIRAIEPLQAHPSEVRTLADLAEAIEAGQISRLVILGGNPVYTAPADIDLDALVRRVPLSVHLGQHRDETAAACHWHIPESHPLESWGDLRAFDGTVGLRQPTTMRLKPGLSVEEFLGLMAGQNTDGRGLVQAAWREAWGDAFEERWARSLEDGVVEGSAAPAVNIIVQPDWRLEPAVPASSAGIDVLFAPDPSIWDGSYANNGWLQELPKPLTKQVWGNAALIAPETAEIFGLSSGDAIDLSLNGRIVRAPVWLLPGHAPGAVTLTLGYGRQTAGRIGNGIGFDAYAVRSSDARWVAPGEIRRVGEKIPVISTQQHHSLQGRDIVRVVAPGEAMPPEPVHPSIYPEWPYKDHAWGMAIDLDACIGCNACVIACQAENNIAVVGPEEVAKGREMHWLRVDRYYAGDPVAPKTYFQPVPCMHCEKAPCEVVCPVNATVHSSEGLNDMVYNRCVGTRTCSNNCPYKVRRFNFVDYQGTDVSAPIEAMNPQVTVRDRGVMEKCTFCVQRIGTARANARVEDRRLADGEVMTACQQACPTQAIVFGDINDPDSTVSRLKGSPRNYALLGALNTKPRTTYLARIESKENG
ncbi:molybdopterin-containing oxidoreductase family iron-sulfur binding subunit [Microvirga lupini]|uniref:Molybdopterin-containing oxidoreductase family iron-sulfur binding subunit n=1 Tax=Microvirga lupini TaxID=420324 RepID=A0A7W4YXY7_9HYPH|nr:TAT-variant-translocated molybdopterin oxidoreductase [Microvirga lupini]MBB3019699.1 molybdopterin-containing oxidoreductase family iron-sulfur binding subunit [Microvirga lupini]